MPKRPKNLSARISLFCLALVLIAGASAYPLRVLQAELGIVEVRASLTQWDSRRAVPSLAVWNEALATVEHAIALDARNAEYYRLQGVLQEWRGFSIEGEALSLETILSSRRLAVSAYRQVAHLRPNNASAWSALARTKTLAGENDAEFKQALRNAIAYGANLDRITLEVTFIASRSWQALLQDPPLLAEVKAVVARGLQVGSNARARVKYLQDQDLLQEFCVDPARLPQSVQDACNSEG